MRSIALLGRGRLAILALRAAEHAGYEIRKVVCNAVEPAWDERLSEYVATWHKGVDLDTSGDWRSLIGMDVDLVLSVMYDRRIGGGVPNPCDPSLILKARVLNLHLGKLPEYRGMRPINWALKNGESVAGVTLHEVELGFDTGPIVAQSTFSIWPDVDEVQDVYRRAVGAGKDLLFEVLPIVDRIKAVPQDESRAGYYTTADMAKLGDRLDWRRP